MKSYIHLGKVVDRDKGVYDNKELGLVTFDLERGTFVNAEPADALRPLIQERLILDFGDVYFLDWYIREKGFMEYIDSVDVPRQDTLRALVVYYIVSRETVDRASWYAGSYTRMLYPEANMDGRRVSEFYEAVGEEGNYRAFYKKHIPLVTKEKSDVRSS